MNPVKMILDTDIGTDVDDALALAFALPSPEIELLAVSVVSTDLDLRGRLAAKMLKTWGRADIPVGTGPPDSFDGKPAWANPVNQAGVLTEPDPVPPDNAIVLIYDTIMSHPGEVTLTSIGALTNVAEAFDRAPELADNVQRLVMMAGSVAHEVKSEYNIRCDPAAAAYVFDLPVEKILVPLDVTTRCKYRQHRHAELAQAGTERANLLWRMIQAWQEAGERTEPTLHDPLAIAVTFMPELVKLEPMCLAVATEATPGVEAGQLIVQDSEPNVQVAMDVDVDRFEALFAERLVQ